MGGILCVFMKEFIREILGWSNYPKSCESIPEFWIWFQNNERKFARAALRKARIEEEFYDKLSPMLNLINSDVFYLVEISKDERIVITFTSDSIIKNAYFIDELVSAAPYLDRWEFRAFRQGVPIDEAIVHLGGYLFNKDNLSFYSSYDKNCNEVALTIVYTDFDLGRKRVIEKGVMLFLENYLGELELVANVDRVKVTGWAEHAPFPIENLRDFIRWEASKITEKMSEIVCTVPEYFSSVIFKSSQDKPFFAIINYNLLDWSFKSAYPWILELKLKFEGVGANNMPDDHTYSLLQKVESTFHLVLPRSIGFVFIGSETSSGKKMLFFASRDFRCLPATLRHAYFLHKEKVSLEYNIYKDLNWKNFDRFKRSDVTVLPDLLSSLF